jgi:flavin-dependent dehydrogenase
LTTLEDGKLDVAAALVRGGSRGDANTQPIDRIRKILDRSTFGSAPLSPRSPIMATGPLRRTRLAGRGRLMAIGDAAGYVEPFTGEGMTWALESGIAAADHIAAAGGDVRFLGDRWHDALARQSYRRRLRCRGVTAMLRWGPARRVTGVALAAFPQLASPLVRSLDRGSQRGGSLPT